MQKLWFGDIKLFSEAYLKKLRDLAGITGIIPDNYQLHVPGYRVSEELLDRSIFPRGWTEWPAALRDIAAGGDTEIIFPMYVGVAVQTDDAPVLKLLEDCDKLGMEARMHAGLWGYAGNILPELGFVDVFGGTIDERMSPYAIPMCPNEKAVLDWEAESIVDVMKRYGSPSANIDHGHYPPLSNPHGMFGCACGRCQESAGGLGYDWAAMTEAVRELFLRLKRATVADLEHVYKEASSWQEAFSALGAGEGVFNWFEYRSKSVSGHIHAVSEAIIKGLGKRVPIDSHLMPPSMAYLSGQDVALWAKSVEYASAGWGSAVGWEEAVIKNFIELAELIADTVNTNEKFVLELLYRIFGYEDVALPTSIGGLLTHDFSSFDVYKKEIMLAATAMPEGGKILYPFDATKNMRGRMDEMAELISSLRPEGIVCFNWGLENSDDELRSIGKCS